MLIYSHETLAFVLCGLALLLSCWLLFVSRARHAALGYALAAVVSCMMLDKKTEGRELRFVLPSRIGHVEVVKGLSPEQALKCL